MTLFDWPDRSAIPLQVPWSTDRMVNDVLEFRDETAWQAFLRERDLNSAVPAIVARKFLRAQKLFALAWYEYGLIKAGELVALTALEMALRDQYATLARGKRHKDDRRAMQVPMFDELIRYQVNHDGLTEDQLPSVRGHGQNDCSFLFEPYAARKVREKHNRDAGVDIQPPTTLVGIRNSMAHGDPFDGLPWCGLLDLVRDLVHHAYRDRIAETASTRSA